MAVVEQFIRDSDNAIKLTLTEDGVAITGAWSELEIFVNDVSMITRAADGDGVTLSVTTGLLTINPGDLTAAEKLLFAALESGQYYSVQIVVTSATNDDGAVFGGQGGARIKFQISDKPA